MTHDELRLLWARWLAAEPLTPEEHRALTAALEEDAELRDALLDDLDLDGALRGLAEGRRREDSFNRTMSAIVAPERDATRFIRKVEAALAGPASRPPSSTKIPAVRDSRTHRFTRRARQGEGDSVAWKVGVAAAALFALVVVAAVGRPSRAPAAPRTGEVVKNEAAPRDPAPEPKRDVDPRPEPKAPAVAEPERRPELPESRPEAPVNPPARRPDPAPAPTAPAVVVDRPTKSEPAPAPLPADPATVSDGALHAVNATTDTYRKGALPEDLDLLANRTSGASIRWADGTTIDLKPSAVIALVRDPAGRRVVVKSGAVVSKIAKQPEGRPMVFQTAQAEARILGTVIRLTAEPGSSVLEVVEGKVEFVRLSDRKSVVVAAGQLATAAAGSELAASRDVFQGMDEIRFVFGPADATKYDAARYKLDSGSEFSATRGYGWRKSPYSKVMWNGVESGHVGPGRNTPSKAPEEARLGHVAAGWGPNADTWAMPLPNGKYLVTVGVGDWSVEHGPNRVTIEDKVVVADVITKAPKHYAEFSAEIVVKDGEFTMICGGSESRKLPQDGSLDTILNYLVIRKK